MKVKSLLAKAASCKTDTDVEKLLDTLIRVFGNAKPLAHLPIHNQESFLENGSPFVYFELNQEINDHYITTIRPEIRDNKLVVVVVTNHMKDGLGMNSKSWVVASGIDEEVIEADFNDTVAMLAQRAKELAVHNHQKLIIGVGVPAEIAKLAAQKSW